MGNGIEGRGEEVAVEKIMYDSIAYRQFCFYIENVYIDAGRELFSVAG